PPPFTWLDEVLPEASADLRIPDWASPLERAEIEVGAGRYRRALYSLGDGFTEDETRAAIVRVRALSALGRTDEALELAGSKEWNSPTLLCEHARVLARVGRVDDAIKLLQDQIAIWAGSAEVRYELGRLLELRGRYEEARAT
ncbi:MAG TPA: tetratricopeptide repeat protein, partial [Tepidisphaeraceae bacterium]|nr:tetratricopeptide repeat protein [Tepidisphaeraceae bacterium]